MMPNYQPGDLLYEDADNAPIWAQVVAPPKAEPLKRDERAIPVGDGWYAQQVDGVTMGYFVPGYVGSSSSPGGKPEDVGLRKWGIEEHAQARKTRERWGLAAWSADPSDPNNYLNENAWTAISGIPGGDPIASNIVLQYEPVKPVPVVEFKGNGYVFNNESLGRAPAVPAGVATPVVVTQPTGPVVMTMAGPPESGMAPASPLGSVLVQATAAVPLGTPNPVAAVQAAVATEQQRGAGASLVILGGLVAAFIFL